MDHSTRNEDKKKKAIPRTNVKKPQGSEQGHLLWYCACQLICTCARCRRIKIKMSKMNSNERSSTNCRFYVLSDKKDKEFSNPISVGIVPLNIFPPELKETTQNKI